MSNKNCLAGVRCPACGNEKHFRISGETIFDVRDSGSEAEGDHEWGDDSETWCTDCDYSGAFWFFQRSNQTTRGKAKTRPKDRDRERRLAAVLCGLRLFQKFQANELRCGLGSRERAALETIAMDGGEALSNADVDALCEHLNFGGAL